jgi:hypothetical protein
MQIAISTTPAENSLGDKLMALAPLIAWVSIIESTLSCCLDRCFLRHFSGLVGLVSNGKYHAKLGFQTLPTLVVSLLHYAACWLSGRSLFWQLHAQ